MQSSIPGHLGECAGLVLLPPWRSLPLPQPPSCVGSCSSPSRPVGGRERADVLITWKLRITLEMKGTWREGGVKSPLRKETRLRNNSHKEASPMQSFTLAKGGGVHLWPSGSPDARHVASGSWFGDSVHARCLSGPHSMPDSPSLSILPGSSDLDSTKACLLSTPRHSSLFQLHSRCSSFHGNKKA